MTAKIGDIYKVTKQIRVVEILKSGNILVCDKFNIGDIWEVEKDDFELYYKKWM